MDVRFEIGEYHLGNTLAYHPILLGNILSQDAPKPITREQKYLMDHKRRYTAVTYTSDAAASTTYLWALMTISRVERMSVSRNRHTNVCNNTTTKLQMNKKIVSKPGRTQGLFQRAELHDFSESRKIAASNLPHSVKWGVINCVQG